MHALLELIIWLHSSPPQFLPWIWRRRWNFSKSILIIHRSSGSNSQFHIEHFAKLFNKREVTFWSLLLGFKKIKINKKIKERKPYCSAQDTLFRLMCYAINERASLLSIFINFVKGGVFNITELNCWKVSFLFAVVLVRWQKFPSQQQTGKNKKEKNQ